MRVFYGGQIKKECRGSLAVVVVSGRVNSKKYESFLYATNSNEFTHLTGVGSAHLPDRVYIGVSHDAGESVIRRTIDRNPEEVDLREIDRLVVHSYFLDSNPEKPNRIVLKSTPTGYEVVTEK